MSLDNDKREPLKLHNEGKRLASPVPERKSPKYITLTPFQHDEKLAAEND
jgi:hypothetical protein